MTKEVGGRKRQASQTALDPTLKPKRQPLIRRWTIKVVLFPIYAYQYLIAPLIADTCRFQPSCSNYTKEAIIKHGIVKGIWLGIKRLARCHPWGGQGHNPVP